MAIPRWRTRMVQASVSDHLRAGLTVLGWFDPASGFATTLPLTWLAEHDPAALEEPPTPNSVGISVGDAPEDTVLEIGAGLQSYQLPVFVDVYGENQGTALNIADDIVQILLGQLWSPSRYIPLYDHSVTPHELVTEAACEARLVDARWAGAGQVAWRRAWRIVSFTAVTYFNGPGND